MAAPKKSKSRPYSHFEFYEASVQTPDIHIEWLDGIAEKIRGRPFLSLREDFCGTHYFASEWVKSRKDRTAIGLDLDPAPVAYGKKLHGSKLSASERKRLQIKLQDVRTVTKTPSDLIIAGNFSFNIFHERADLLKYFRAAYRSLSKDKGVFCLETAGGPGMITKSREQRSLELGGRGRERRKFIYYWDQKKFDPIHQRGQYAIHFKTPDGEMMRDAFTYDWRLWNIPELRDVLREAGFKKTVVFWESSHAGEGTGEFASSEEGDNAFSWIAYVVGIRE